MSAPPGENVLEIRFPSQGNRLKLVRSLVHDAAMLCGCSEDCADRMVIAVNEACMNVIQHAYQQDPNGEIILAIWHDQDRMIFRLVDFASPVDVEAVRPRDLDDVRPGGLGTHFIREVMDDIAFLPPPDGAGNLFQMVKRIS